MCTVAYGLVSRPPCRPNERVAISRCLRTGKGTTTPTPTPPRKRLLADVANDPLTRRCFRTARSRNHAQEITTTLRGKRTQTSCEGTPPSRLGGKTVIMTTQGIENAFLGRSQKRTIDWYSENLRPDLERNMSTLGSWCS